MSECDEIADNMSLPALASFDECLAYVAQQMPGESRAGTIVNNVAWSLWQRIKRSNMTYKFAAEDNGNCRVYYRKDRALFCWQYEGRSEGWQFYVCSQDGEPSHRTQVPPVTPKTPGEESIGRELNAWLSQL